MNNVLRPWDRQADESAKAFEAFAIYRDMGPDRSQEAVSRQLAKSRQLLSRWAARYDWVERVAAWERYLDAPVQQDQVDDRRAIQERLRGAKGERRDAVADAAYMAAVNPGGMASDRKLYFDQLAPQVQKVAPTTPAGDEAWQPTMTLEEAARILGLLKDDDGDVDA